MANAGAWEEINATHPNCLSAETIESLKELGFPTMTPVQRSVIPYLLNFKDVAVQAITGSGKTLAFLVPAIEFLRKYGTRPGHGITVLVLLPTRELAKQVAGVFEQFVQYHPFIVTQLMTGGNDSIEDDISFLKTNEPNLMIATPGRLNELITMGEISVFRELELLVVDEADRILQMGQEAHLSNIFEKLRRQRRTGLFSATLTTALHELIRTGMRNPVLLKVKSEAAVPEELLNWYTICDPEYKLTQLVHFVNTETKGKKVIIFVLTTDMVDYFTDVLKILVEGDRQVLPLYGKMKQSDRETNLDDFRNLDEGILIATDVAARGIDIPDVDWIIQFDAPQDPNMFIHRVGRTARIGRKGNALLFLREHEAAYAIYMENNDVEMEEMEVEIPSDGDEMLMKLREYAKENQKFYEKSRLAMVSYARAYGEHKLKQVLLRKSEVDFVALGISFGLVRLPTMPELKDHKQKCLDYNQKYAEYAAPYVTFDAKQAERERREKEKKKKEKKKRTAEEEIVMYQKHHRRGGFKVHKKH